MPSQRLAYSQLPAWLLIIAMLIMGSGWTLEGWIAGTNTGVNTGVNTGANTGYNFGYNSGFNSGVNHGVNTGFNSGYNAGYNSGYNSGYNGPGFSWSCPPSPMPYPGFFMQPSIGWWFPFSFYQPLPPCYGLESVTLQFMGNDGTIVVMILEGLPEVEVETVYEGLVLTLNATVMGLERLPDNLILVSNGLKVTIPLSCYELQAGQVYGDFGIVDLEYNVPEVSAPVVSAPVVVPPAV